MNRSTFELEETCILCNTNKWMILYTLGDFRIVKCFECGLCKTDPFSTSDEVDRIHANIYTIENRLAIYSSRKNEFVGRYRRQLREISAVKNNCGNKLLDVGCSAGFFLKIAKDEGYEVFGIEVSEETGNYAQQKYGLDVFIGTLTDAGFPDKRFDVITLWDVIEHVHDPNLFLLEVKRILKDDGILAIQSPNMDSQMASFSKDKWCWWTVPDHLFHFNPYTLSRLMEMSGFHIEMIYTWEPSRDLMMSLLSKYIYGEKFKFGTYNKLANKIVYLVSMIAWPILIPFQKKQWKQMKGGLVVAYARVIKRDF
jgi:SAM-dependent methyltransferase